MKKFTAILLATMLIGCEAHLVTKELYVAGAKKESASQCASAKILPVELSNEIKSNSVFWLPIIPAPWNEKKEVEKIRIEVAYEPMAKECKASEVNFILEGIKYSPEMAFLYSFREREARCIYEFHVSGSEASRNNAVVQFNKDGICEPKDRPLIYRKKTVYENHFQPW
jgi:hypothetical protein